MTVISEGDVEAIEPVESRTRRTSEEGHLEVFDSDEMDINEEVGSSEETTTHLDLIT